MLEDFEDIPWLRPFKPRKPSGFVSGKKRTPIIRRTRETWAFKVVSEKARVSKGGQIKLFKYNRTSPLAIAGYADVLEGDRMFEEVWERAQEATREEEARLGG